MSLTPLCSGIFTGCLWDTISALLSRLAKPPAGLGLESGGAEVVPLKKPGREEYPRATPGASGASGGDPCLAGRSLHCYIRN